MKKQFKFKKIMLYLFMIFILIQVFRIDKTNAPADPGKDIITVTQAAPEISGILRTSCYDCHSNESTYPWYTNIAPFSWWIKHHMDEGRDELNFSEWGDYKERRKDHKLKESIEMVEEGEMPLSSYTLMHGEAELSKEQQTALVKWFTGLRTYESDKPKE